MSKYMLSFLLVNSISTVMFFKYIYNKFTRLYDTKIDKINWLEKKVIILENEVNELHEIINNLEVDNKKVKKELDHSNQQRTSLNEKLDFMTKTTYDVIENDSSSDSKIFSTLEFNKSQYEI